MNGARIHITGIVQGVGFRPFVYNLAMRMGLRGWVRNTSAGVDIQVEADDSTLEAFACSLRESAPPLALIASLEVDPCPPNGFSTFEIIHSEPIPGAFQPISPDVSICDDCLRELFDPKDRRYRYPFINCTNCGPRFTIIQDIPYDRPQTTMAPFEMCDQCRSEYEDPRNRRFHAQPVACAECGPHVWLELGDMEIGVRRLGDRNDSPQLLTPNSQLLTPISHPANRDAILESRKLLVSGYIVAIKGLGGFHLACDATNPEAVAELRRRKLRADKPFALMMPGVETIARHCYLNDDERALLESPQRPIVLLQRRPESNIAAAVAPGQNTLGVMLPYTPLHYLLFSLDTDSHGFPRIENKKIRVHPCSSASHLSALVMTSGNLSEEPIATDNEEAHQRLSDLADAFLMHDREIHVRCDDSVIRVRSYELGVKNRVAQPLPPNSQPAIYPLRRSRGYAPYPIVLPRHTPPILAVGPELKNTFCLTKDRYAFISHHIGDLENYETLRAFEEGIEHYERLFRIEPEIIACDLHPDYLATRYAIDRAQNTNLPIYQIQHHHAHIAACMAEHGLTGDEPVIGVSFDGAGYGDDGAIWGGEFLLADYRGYHRFAHLAYTPLPGGDKAIKEPWRMALSWLHTAGIAWDDELPPGKYAKLQVGMWASEHPLTPNPQPLAPDSLLASLHLQLTTGLNAPPTSSIGRLFDAVSALTGVRQTVNYEAQAAIELEALADPDEMGGYQISIDNSPFINPAPIFHAIISDLRTGVNISAISARFHNGLARMVTEVALVMRREFGIHVVAFSGGVWQNMTLLYKSLTLLEKEGFEVLIHEKTPTNDGGLSLGQAMIAARQPV